MTMDVQLSVVLVAFIIIFWGMMFDNIIFPTEKEECVCNRGAVFIGGHSSNDSSKELVIYAYNSTEDSWTVKQYSDLPIKIDFDTVLYVD